MPDGSRAAGVSDAGLLTIANLITFCRLCLVPVVVWLLLHEKAASAFWTFAVAGASDMVDGWTARRWGTSRFGALLDPISDKIMIVAVTVTLAAIRALPDWLVILIVFRDILIVGGVLGLAVLGHRVAIRPLMFSKANTALQIVLVALVLGLAAFGLSAVPLLTAMIWLTAATTVASGAMYVVQIGRSH